jgi:hypothetical protein
MIFEGSADRTEEKAEILVLGAAGGDIRREDAENEVGDCREGDRREYISRDGVSHKDVHDAEYDIYEDKTEIDPVGSAVSEAVTRSHKRCQFVTKAHKSFLRENKSALIGYYSKREKI